MLSAVEKAVGAVSPGIRFQRHGTTFNNRRPDSLILMPGGQRIPIQICIDNKIELEARALVDLCQVPELDFVLSVCRNKRKLALMEKTLKKLCGGSVPGKLVMVDVESCFRPDFDWVTVLARNT